MAVKFYTLKKPVPMEPWHMGVPVNNLYISSKLLLQGHPKKGDMIAVIDGQNTLMSAEEFSRYQEVGGEEAKPEEPHIINPIKEAKEDIDPKTDGVAIKGDA